MKKMRNQGRGKTPTPRRSPRGAPIIDEEEQILRAATIHLIRHHGGLLLATDLREQPAEGGRTWVLTVTLRYPTGHEGYIGDLLYDGKEFTFLTPEDVRKERARQISEDPEGVRNWNEYRTSTLQAGEEKHLRPGLPADGAGGVPHADRRERPRSRSTNGSRGNAHR